MATCWLLASLLLLASAAGDESVVTGRPAGCQARCGDVDIPYPFGIGPNCSRGEGFEIACNTRNGSGDLVPTLAAANGSIHVQSLSVEQLPEVKVMLPVHRPVIFRFLSSSFNLVKFSILHTNFPKCPSDFLAPARPLPAPLMPAIIGKLRVNEFDSLITCTEALNTTAPSSR